MKKWLSFVAFASVKFLYFSGIILSFSICGYGQEMTTRVYTEKDGLASTYVSSTYQDKLGYLWIRSSDGISRFDGKYFTNCGPFESMPLLMDSHLRLWFASSRDVSEFKVNKLISYPFSDSENIRWVYQVLETGDRNVWCLTSAGVYQFDFDKWQKVELYPGYENHACRDIIETKEGLYINYGDLLLLRRPDGVYKIIGELKDLGYYYNDLTLSGGKILISTLDGIYQIINERLVKLPGPLGKLKGIYIYFRDSKKRFWVSSFKMGLKWIADGDTTDFISIYNSKTDYSINSISEDNQGNIWVSTEKGLIRFSEKGFKIFNTGEMTRDKFLRNVFQPPTGPILINNGSLTLYSFVDGKFPSKNLKNSGKTKLPNDEFIIDNYAFDDKGRSWYSIRGVALAMQEGNNVYVQSSALAHLGSQVFDVLYDSFRKKILVAVLEQKYPCEYSDTKYQSMNIANDIKVQGYITRLHQCDNGVILFATDQGLIYSVDKQNNCKLQLSEFNAKGLIEKFIKDPSGDTWIIYYGKGLRRYSWDRDTLIFKEQLTMANGLSTDNVNDLCFDNKNNLWASSNSQVTVFSTKRNSSNELRYHIVSYFNASELNTEGGIGPWLTKDNAGNIWYSSSRHLICFYPDKINYSSPVPATQIENVELNLRQTNWTDYSDSVAGIFQLPHDLHLSYENNTLSFYFKGVSSSSTEGIKYSYRLEGLENLWSNPSSNYFVSFARLPPGKYVFMVKSQLPNTDWSEPAVFSFTIIAPFWMRWWFIGLCALTLSGIIYSIYKYRINQLKKLLAIRTKISQDLHDEIGSTLTSINILSKVSQNNLEKDKSKASELLQKISEQSADMQQSMSDIVWSIRPDNDTMENLAIRMREYLGQTAEARNMQVGFSADEKVLNENLSMQHRQHIFLIFKEAVNNAVKYSGAKTVAVFLGRENGYIRLRVKDDGTGFNAARITSSSGLKNMQARAKAMNGTLNIRTEPGSGTEVELICNAT